MWSRSRGAHRRHLSESAAPDAVSGTPPDKIFGAMAASQLRSERCSPAIQVSGVLTRVVEANISHTNWPCPPARRAIGPSQRRFRRALQAGGLCVFGKGLDRCIRELKKARNIQRPYSNLWAQRWLCLLSLLSTKAATAGTRATPFTAIRRRLPEGSRPAFYDGSTIQSKPLSLEEELHGRGFEERRHVACTRSARQVTVGDAG
jgi:hypothetical protein